MFKIKDTARFNLLHRMLEPIKNKIMIWKNIYYEIRWYPHRVAKYGTLWLWGERMRKVRAKAKRDKYRRKGYKRLRNGVYKIKRLGGKCELCGISEQLQIHHKLPVSEGGDCRIENLQVLCRECHLKIHQNGIPKTA